MTTLVTPRPVTGPAAEPPAPPSKGLVYGVLGGLAAVVVYALATGHGLYLLGAFGFLVALLVSVTLHEGGHFWTARKFGMKATQFFVGFGPTLWSTQRGETEWGIKAIPAGGFVKIVGMTSLEEVAPGDEQRAFWRQKPLQRTIVLAAGSTVHFLIAIALVLLSALVIGKPVERAPAIGALSACVPATATAECTDAGSAPSPAKAAGLQAGDVLVAVAGQPTKDYLGFLEQIRARPGQSTEVVVDRDGARRTVTLTPARVERPTLDLQDAATAVETVGAIGVAPQARQATGRLNPIDAVQYTGETLKLIVVGTVETFTKKLGTITEVYGDNRDPAGFIGVVGAGRISGEVITSQETLGIKLLTFLIMVASLNLFVGVFNLLPLLPLDGGHIAVLAFEQARDRVRRLFGFRGELRRVDLNKLLPVTYAVVVFFAGFTVWLLGADLVNPIRIS